MENELYKLYDVKQSKNNTIGMVEKCEISKKNRETGIYERGLFKRPINDSSKDNVAEAIVYRIAMIVGVPCVKAMVVMHNGNIGSFSRYEIDELDKVEHLRAVLGISELHIDDFFETIKNMRVKNVGSLYARAYQYVTLDYLTGQQDRHMENLAFIRDRDNIQFYPLYDNGLSMHAVKSNSICCDYLYSNKYSSRMGNSSEIYNALKREKGQFKNLSIENIIKISNISDVILHNIIREEDRYKQINNEREKAMVSFIMQKKKELMQL